MPRLISILLLIFAARADGQQTPAFSVQARVLDDIRGEPLSNARIVVIDANAEPVLVARTDSAGNLNLNLGAGRFQLKVEKGGYFPAYFRELDSADPTTGRLGEIVLTARRSISGTVSWRDGGPAAAARITACAVKAGQIGTPCGYATADDNGAFWAGNLAPGRYILHVQNGESGTAQVQRGLPVFFPGNTTPDLAAPIDLRNTPSPANVQIWLEDRAGVSVEGRFVYANAPESPFPPRVSLLLPGDNPRPLLSVTVTPENTFRFDNVPQGSYNLVALFQDRGVGLFWAVLPIQVGATPLSGLTLTIPETPTIPGKFEIDSGAGPQPYGGGFIAGVARSFSIRGSGAKSDAEGNFALVALQFESFELMFGDLPPGIYVSRVTQDGKVQVREPFRAASAGGALHVLLRNDTGGIHGRVPPRRTASRSAFLVLAASDPTAGPAPRTTEADRIGDFEFLHVPPGRYNLYVFDREEDYEGEKALAQATAIAVTVRAGERTRLEPNPGPQ